MTQDGRFDDPEEGVPLPSVEVYRSSWWSFISSWAFPRHTEAVAEDVGILAEGSIGTVFPPRRKREETVYATLMKSASKRWSRVLRVRSQRVVIIGMHGWAILGGVLSNDIESLSRRLCAYSREALQPYIDGDAAILEIPLSGHGLIQHRLRDFLQELQPYYNRIATADVLILSCHSQGVIVGTSVLHELFEMNVVSPGTRVGMLSIAGVHHGPFPDLSMPDFYTSTRQLFALTQPWSGSSKRHKIALSNVLRKGVFYYCVGSWKDQVVPLYSALLQGYSPSRANLKRVLFVDQRELVDENHFLLFLIQTILEKQNEVPQVSHSLLVYLSGHIRGSVLRDSFHSTVHDEIGVYQGAMEFIMTAPKKSSGSTHIDMIADVEWGSHFTDSFFHSKQGAYLFDQSLFRFCKLLTREQRSTLAEGYNQWASRRPDQHLCTLLKPLAGMNPSPKL